MAGSDVSAKSIGNPPTLTEYPNSSATVLDSRQMHRITMTILRATLSEQPKHVF